MAMIGNGMQWLSVHCYWDFIANVWPKGCLRYAFRYAKSFGGQQWNEVPVADQAHSKFKESQPWIVSFFHSIRFIFSQYLRNCCLISHDISLQCSHLAILHMDG